MYESKQMFTAKKDVVMSLCVTKCHLFISIQLDKNKFILFHPTK